LTVAVKRNYTRHSLEGLRLKRAKLAREQLRLDYSSAQEARKEQAKLLWFPERKKDGGEKRVMELLLKKASRLDW
jgi:hypothetical protein